MNPRIPPGIWEGLTPPYSTIVADPPWHYDERVIEWGRERGAVSKPMPYSTMTAEEIAALPVFDLAADRCDLYLWTTQRYLWDARHICLGWGFAPSQVLVWCKPPAGLTPGGTFASSAEFVVFARRYHLVPGRVVERAGALIRAAREANGMTRAELHRAVRGGTPTGIVFRWEDDDSLPNDRDWQRLQQTLPQLAGIERPHVPPAERVERPRIDRCWWEWSRGAHSAKPAAFLDVVEVASEGPYVELFARAPRLGWDSWGYGYESAVG